MHQDYVNRRLLYVISNELKNTQNLHNQTLRLFLKMLCKLLDFLQVWKRFILSDRLKDEPMVKSGKKQLPTLSSVHVGLLLYDFYVLFDVQRANYPAELLFCEQWRKHFWAKWSHWVVQTNQTAQLFLNQETLSWTDSSFNVILNNFFAHRKCVAFLVR